MYIKAKKGESLLGQLGVVLDEIPAQQSSVVAPVTENGKAAAAAQPAQEQPTNGKHTNLLRAVHCQ